MKISLVLLYVKDFDRMADFYREVIGLEEMPETRQEGWVEFAAGGIRLGLHAIPEAMAADIVISSPPEVRDESPMKLYFEGDAKRLQELGVAMVQRPWGGWDGIDPEGNVFGIVQKAADLK